MRRDYQTRFYDEGKAIQEDLYFNKVQEITQITGERLEKLYSEEITVGLKNDDSSEKTASHIIRTEMAVLSHI